MREIVAATFLSLDGVMQAPGGPDEDRSGGFTLGGWIVNYGDEVTNQAVMESFAAPFDLLLGRKTYEIFAAHWPFTRDDGPIAEAFNRATKYVASRSGIALDWQNSVSLGDDVVARLIALKQEEGPPLLIQGSGDLIQTLLRHDLIDEIKLMIFPLVLGKGKRLFGAGAMPAAMRLVDSKVSPSGVMIGRYRRDGAVKPGSFAMAEPSPAEIERRRKWTTES